MWMHNTFSCYFTVIHLFSPLKAFTVPWKMEFLKQLQRVHFMFPLDEIVFRPDTSHTKKQGRQSQGRRVPGIKARGQTLFRCLRFKIQWRRQDCLLIHPLFIHPFAHSYIPYLATPHLNTEKTWDELCSWTRINELVTEQLTWERFTGGSISDRSCSQRNNYI